MKTTTTMKAKLLVAAIAIASFGPGVFAQGGMAAQSGSTKGAVLKGKAPVNKNVLRVKLPRAQEATLKNGLHVVVLESKNHLPIFSMEMVVMSGGMSDSADLRGVASATAALLREGTAKHNSREISELLDTIGANLNANSGLSSFTSNVTSGGLVENFDQVLDLMAEIVRTPKFPTEEVERYKSRIIAQYPLLRSQPQLLAQERLNKAIYGDHPASLAFVPIDSLKKITPDDLVRFHSQNYLPNNATLFIAGDVTLKQLLPKVEHAFGDWPGGTAPTPTIPAIPAQADAKISLINRPGSVQTVFQIGSLGLERTDPDYVALVVMNRILGGGGSSRLFLNIREDKGYAYSVGSGISASKYRGLFTAQSPVRTEVTDGTMHEFMYEFNRIRDEKVSATDLENAKHSIIGAFALSLENSQGLLNNIITQKLYSLPADYWDTYPQKVEAITADDVQRVAQKYIDLQHLQIVAVTDAAKARAALAKYGTIQEFDADGKPAQASKN